MMFSLSGLRFASAGGFVRRLLIAVLVCAPLGACGFQPMYGPSLEPHLASIYVEPIAERDGYELRNTLINLLGSDGHAAGKAYRLAITLNESSQGIALQNDADITRYNDTLSVSWVLTDSGGKTVTQGTQSSLSSYDVSNSPYSTLAGQQDSDKRAADDIAERIRLDLGAWFHRAH